MAAWQSIYGADKVGPRTPVKEWGALQPGFGTSRTWSREIYGTLYSFTAVLMPDGERRYAVKKYNGYIGGPSWGCAWEPVKFITIKGESR